MSELEELLPWMLAGASSRSCFFVIKKKQRRDTDIRKGVETKKGEKSPGI